MVHYGVVVFYEILFLVGIERLYEYVVGVAMVGGQDVLIAIAGLDGEAPSFVRVDL